jgi:drug/metabolite transporter (DMT)-like permease
MTPTNNLKGALLALAAFAIYATHDVIVRYLGGAYSPMQILFFTSLFSFPLITLILVRDTTQGNLRPVHPWWMALRSLSMVVAGLCAFYAFSVLPMAQVYAILFTVPLLVTLLSIPILGEKVGLHRALAVVVGLGGVLVVVRPGSAELSLGHLAAFTAAFFASAQSVITRRIGNEERQVVMLLFPYAAIFVVMGAGLGFVYQPMPLLDLAAVGAIAILGFIAAALLVGAYRAGEAALVAPMQYSQIVWAAIFGSLLFNETMDSTTIIGAAIVIGSGVYIVAREALSGNSENRPVLRTRSRTASPGSPRISQVLRRRKS